MSETTTCITDGCDRPRVARGLCLKHYKQANNAGTLPPLLCNLCGTHISKGRRVCDTCRLIAKAERRQLQNDKKKQERRANAKCQSCGETRPRARRFCESCAANRTRQLRFASNLARFGMSEHDYWLKLAEQRHSCAICKLPVWDRAERKLYAVDHNHKCCSRPGSCGECVRGILCVRCNLGLGSFGDDPDTLRAAADYVETHERQQEIRRRYKFTRGHSSIEQTADEAAA